MRSIGVLDAWASLCLGARAASVALLVVFAIGAAHALAAESSPGSLDQVVTVNVAPQSLGKALLQFGDQTHLQVMLATSNAEGYMSEGVKGTFAARVALTKLLVGSGLSYQADKDTITVGPVGERRTADAKSFRLAEGLSKASTASVPSSASLSYSDQPAGQSGGHSSELEEVVVSAEKRDERLQDVPVPVTVINADSLVSDNQLRFQDYYSSVPGLDLALDNRGDPAIAIRGITTSIYGNPTVGIVVDDVPYGATTSAAFQWAATDIDPSELARVEVLRGPQGTLYGASSIGGLIKYVTVDPSTDRLSGRLEAGAVGVYSGDQAGYIFRAATNVPVSDTLAVRAGGFTRYDPGYVDNVETSQKGINWVKVDGGHIAALWKPAEDFSLKLSALYEKSELGGSPNVELGIGLGDLQQEYPRDTGAYAKTFQAYSATISAKLGNIDLKAISGYGINRSAGSFDATNVFATYTLAQFGVTGTPWVEDNKTDKFTQEIRLSSHVGSKFDWMLAGFYTHEYTYLNGGFLAIDPMTGAQVGVWSSDVGPVTYAEFAAFTDMTVHITDQLDLQFGARESQNKQSYQQTDTGPYNPVILGEPYTLVSPEVGSKDNSFTYLVTPRFKISPDLMVYARLASGYRPGGPNSTVTVGSGLPTSFGPDTTNTYEFGVKGDFRDHTLSIDASVYYINWKDIQITLSDPVNYETYIVNSGRAKSDGLELSLESKPLAGLTLGAWVTVSDAELTEDFPSTTDAYGNSGDRLPYSSRFSGNVSVQQEFAVTSRVTGFAGATISYVGDREGEFAASPGSPQRQGYPGYTKMDLRAGARWDAWNLNMYVNNATDRRGVLAGGLASLNSNAFTIIQPRTVGASVSVTLGR